MLNTAQGSDDKSGLYVGAAAGGGGGPDSKKEKSASDHGSGAAVGGAVVEGGQGSCVVVKVVDGGLGAEMSNQGSVGVLEGAGRVGESGVAVGCGSVGIGVGIGSGVNQGDTGVCETESGTGGSLGIEMAGVAAFSRLAGSGVGTVADVDGIADGAIAADSDCGVEDLEALNSLDSPLCDTDSCVSNLEAPLAWGLNVDLVTVFAVTPLSTFIVFAGFSTPGPIGSMTVLMGTKLLDLKVDDVGETVPLRRTIGEACRETGVWAGEGLVDGSAVDSVGRACSRPGFWPRLAAIGVLIDTAGDSTISPHSSSSSSAVVSAAFVCKLVSNWPRLAQGLDSVEGF